MRNDKVREILKLYEKRRDYAETILDEKKRKLYNQIPEIEIIDNEISTLGLSLAKLILLNPNDKDTIVNDAKDKMNLLKEKKDNLLKKHNIPDDYLELKHKCKKCNDKAFLPNGDKCSCFKQEMINESYKMSNLSRVLEKQNFENFNLSLFSTTKDEGFHLSPMENMLDILKISEDFKNNFSKDNDENLLFYGDTGSGKTFMCNCIAKDILDKGYTVIYQTAFKIFEIIKEYSFKNSDSNINKDDYNNIFECDLLIIDDLGTELANSFTNSELFNIINTRLLSGKKTIISTNHDPSQLGEIYAQRIFSRISESFRFVRFIGNDLRWDQKK